MDVILSIKRAEFGKHFITAAQSENATSGTEAGLGFKIMLTSPRKAECMTQALTVHGCHLWRTNSAKIKSLNASLNN